MSTPNLGIEHVAESQANKEATVNLGFDRLDYAINRLVYKDASSDVVLTDEEFQRNRGVYLRGSTGSAFNLILPDSIDREFVVVNTANQDVNIEIASDASGGITLATGTAGIYLISAGEITEIANAEVSGGGGGGGGTLTVEDEGTEVRQQVTVLNFTGAGVEVFEESDGSVTVSITGTPTQVREETTDYTLTDDDLSGNRILEFNSASPVNVVIESGLTGVEPVTIVQTGAGQVSVDEGSGVSLHGAEGLVSTRVQWSALSVIPRGGDSYLVIGDLA